MFEAQREFLRNAGCHHYQGYFFSRPLPVAEFEALVRRTNAVDGLPPQA
jgi:EAL domain-containing protein (putative c-di-GMP-specific phosphodiesterase class I)